MDAVKSPGTMTGIIAITGVVASSVWFTKQLKGVKDDIDSLNEEVNLLREGDQLTKQTKEICNTLASAVQKMNNLLMMHSAKIDKIDKQLYLHQEAMKRNNIEFSDDLARKLFNQRSYNEQTMAENNYQGLPMNSHTNYTNTSFDPHCHVTPPQFNQYQGNYGQRNTEYNWNGMTPKPQEDEIAAEIRKVQQIALKSNK